MSCLLTILLCAAAEVEAQPGETPLLALNSLDGVSATYLTAPPRELTVVSEEGQTTDGDGGILFGGHTPEGDGSKYFGIMVRLAQPVDLHKQAVRFDAKTPAPGVARAFYIRFYNHGESKPAWSFASWGAPLQEEWRSITVQEGLCVDGLAWEAHVVEDRKATKIDRVEFIIGTREEGVDATALVDNLRVLPRKPGIEELTEPKKLIRDTVVVDDGKPTAIVLHPDSEEGREAARAVTDMIRAKTGVEIPARTATTEDTRPGQTAILIGNVNTNPALGLLYARYLTPVDAVCPGENGALVHTVFDPYGKGVNAVVAGASDAGGLTKAVDLLRRVVDEHAEGKSLVLPRLFERAYGADFLETFGWAGDDRPRIAWRRGSRMANAL